jgi:hypothetical protein
MICKNKKCKKDFQKRNHDKRDKNKFCSSKCALTFVRTPTHQIMAAKKSALVMIAKYRGTGTKTYVKENGRHQHRVVMERIIGRKLGKKEIVHHIDGNKKNNDPSNLQLFKNQAEHISHHLKEGNGKLK